MPLLGGRRVRECVLEDLGWNGYFEALWKERFGEDEECVKPARVVSQQRGLWRVAGEFRRVLGGAVG